jgi:hypothetical protein
VRSVDTELDGQALEQLAIIMQPKSVGFISSPVCTPLAAMPPASDFTLIELQHGLMATGNAP